MYNRPSNGMSFESWINISLPSQMLLILANITIQVRKKIPAGLLAKRAFSIQSVHFTQLSNYFKPPLLQRAIRDELNSHSFGSFHFSEHFRWLMFPNSCENAISRMFVGSTFTSALQMIKEKKILIKISYPRNRLAESTTYHASATLRFI